MQRKPETRRTTSYRMTKTFDPGTWNYAERQSQIHRCAVCKGVLVVKMIDPTAPRRDAEYRAACQVTEHDGTVPYTAADAAADRLAEMESRRANPVQRTPEEEAAREQIRRGMWGD